MQIKTKIISSHTADSKPVKQEVNGTVILPPLVFPAQTFKPNTGLHSNGRYLALPGNIKLWWKLMAVAKLKHIKTQPKLWLFIVKAVGKIGWHREF